MTESERQFYMTKRQCLIMELGAIEDMLGLERSIVPKRKRQQISVKVELNDDVAQGFISSAISQDIRRGGGADPLPTR